MTIPPALPRPENSAVQFRPQVCPESARVTGLRLQVRFEEAGHSATPLADCAHLLPDEVLCDSLMAGLRLGLSALRRWDRLGIGPEIMTLPLPDRALADGFLVQDILWELDRTNLEPWRIEIEFDEPGPTGDDARERALAGLQVLGRAGCRLAIGDFGTAASAPTQLGGLSIHRARIGRRFVADCDRDDGQQRIILALLALADHLSMKSIADGVRTAGERALLSQIGLSALQGDGVLPQMSAAGIDDLLLGQRERLPRAPRLLRAV